MMKKIILFLAILFPVILQAATSYEMTSAFPEAVGKKPINFKLSWSEDKGKVTGTYSDNFHPELVPISGVTSETTRIFRVRFKNHQKKLGALTIVTAHSEKDKRFPISIIAQDSKGVPLVAHKAQADLNNISLRQAQEDTPCTEGFGNLAGYCGRYEGIISEEEDIQKACTLADGVAPQLELDDQGTIFIHIGPVSEMVATPAHKVGRIPADHGSNSVDILSRECRPLKGTNFSDNDCKRLNLRGSFSVLDQRKHFAGNYIITDEKNNRVCSYQLSFNLKE